MHELNCVCVCVWCVGTLGEVKKKEKERKKIPKEDAAVWLGVEMSVSNAETARERNAAEREPSEYPGSIVN